MKSQPRTEWTVVMFLGLALIGGVGALARSGVRLPIGRI
jgi:hypothetical protein